MYKITDVAKLKLIGYGKSSIRQFIQEKPPRLRFVNLRQPGDKQNKIRIPESAIREFLAKYGKRNSLK